MDLAPLYTLLEKGPSVQQHGVPASKRRERARAIYRAAKKVRNKAQNRILNALASAIEAGEAREACDLFGKLNAEGRSALPKASAFACGESQLYRAMCALLQG